MPFQLGDMQDPWSITTFELEFFLKLGFTPCKTEQLLRSMELQEKEAQKDYSIHEIYLERNYNLKVSVILIFKAI